MNNIARFFTIYWCIYFPTCIAYNELPGFSSIDELMTGIDEFAESITVVPNTTKRIVNGRLVIERNGKQYSLDGKAL